MSDADPPTEIKIGVPIDHPLKCVDCGETILSGRAMMYPEGPGFGRFAWCKVRCVSCAYLFGEREAAAGRPYRTL